jgi:hypothetical protein
MAERKNSVHAGRLLAHSDGVQVYESALVVTRWADPGSVEQVTLACSRSRVVVRVVRAPSSASDAGQVSHLVLPREDFDTLIASYRACARAEKKACAGGAGTPDDFDPFLDADA